MKKLYLLLCCIIIISFRYQDKPKLYSFTNNLKLRSSLSLYGEIIDTLQKSDMVYYLGEKGDSLTTTIEGNKLSELWLKVETYSGKVGWVFSGGLDFDSTQTNYGASDSFNITDDSVLFVPENRSIPAYSLPQLSSEVIEYLVGYKQLEIEYEGTVLCPVTGIKRIWIKTTNENHQNIFILKSNLQKPHGNEISIDEFKAILTKKFGQKADNIFMFKSIKKFENGDDGSTWTEESELNFDFNSKIISMGYMYTYSRVNMGEIYRDKNRFRFSAKSPYAGDKNIEIEINRDLSINLYNIGELSVKYIQGKAANY